MQKIETHNMSLWPTHVSLNRYLEVEEHNENLKRIAIETVGKQYDEEIRAYDLHKINHPSIEWLKEEFIVSTEKYLSVGKVKDLTIRAVIMQKGSHINTHTETRESDLMLVYWPGGDVGSINSKPDNKLAPAFVMEDPSRHLSELRLPMEIRHSVMIRPQPGLMVIGPAHLPHNLHPYMGEEPFIHIVAQVRIEWPEEYDLRW